MNTPIFRKSLFTLLLFSCSTFLFAQLTEEDINSDTTTVLEEAPLFEIPDTFDLKYIFPNNPDQEYSFKDTLLDYVHQYDPTRRGLYDQAHLGYVGTPTNRLVYEAKEKAGFNIGLNQYELYSKFSTQLPYYETKKIFTNLVFSQGSEQNDNYQQLQFGRKVDKRIYFSLDYTRIRQESQFRDQKGRHTVLDLGFWYKGKNDKYNAFLAYGSNVFSQQNNGGIPNDTFLRQDERPISLLVNLDDAQTRHQHKEVSYTHHLKLNATKDSLFRRQFSIMHKALYRASYYKFSDLITNTSNDTIFYDNLLEDTRGLRHYIGVKTIQNKFAVSTYQLQRDKDIGLKKQRDLLQVGLEHIYYIVEQEPLNNNINNLFLTGKWQYTPNNRLELNTKAKLALLDNRGDYHISGDLFFDLGTIGNFRAKAINQRYAPTLVQQQFFISQQEVWANDFKKPIETNLIATYALPSFNMEFSGRYHLLNNYIYFGSDATPLQESGALNILQLIVRKDFNLGKFHLDNTIVVQEATNKGIIHLPRLTSKHSLYYYGRLFKRALLLKSGFDLRYNDAFLPDAYQPAIGQYHLQDVQEASFYPAVDLFLSFKVKGFRAFFKWENLTHLISNDVFYRTANRPELVSNIRFGIAWQFLDIETKSKKQKNNNDIP